MAKAKGDLVPLLASREAWGLLLWNQIEDEEEGVHMGRAFGKVAAHAAATQMTSATWTLPGKWKWRAYVSAGVHHTLITPGGDAIFVGRDDPHPVLPILRWEELQRLDAALGDPAFALLLAPCTEQQTKPQVAAAIARYTEALTTCATLGMPVAAKVAALLVQRTTSWKQDKRLGWISTSGSSARNPSGHFGKAFAKAKGFAALKQLFAALA